MTFISLGYLLFLPAVVICWSVTPQRFRWLVLLTASIVFYASLKSPILLGALCVVSGVSYCAGIGLTRCTTERRKRLVFWSGVLGICSVLVVLKYPPLLATSANSLIGLLSPGNGIPVPEPLVSIGVSYFVFQGISYLTDIHLGIVEAERHPGYLALYLAFFPKLLQGPIERAGDLLPQLRVAVPFSPGNIHAGAVMFALGLFKKVVIADRLAHYVNPVYNKVTDYSGAVLIVASYLYALQLYFDFSGYTDMARGAARLFGIELTRNFNRPYLATSIADFWRRWHISFSRWILDYIFKPLQMRFRDRGSAGTAAALLITFLVSGIWHGAEWGYVVWGLLHGCYLAFSVLYQPFRKKAQAWIGLTDGPILKVWQTAVTFNLVCFSFIFFRAPSLPDAWHVITHASFGNVSQVASLLIQRGFSELFITVVMLLALLMTGAFRNFADELVMRVQSSHIAWRWTCYYLVLLVIMTVGIFDDQSFIYYRF